MAKMTINECYTATFQLLNQYSIAGRIVPSSYNDQADAQNRMLNLINDAQMTLATTVRPIIAKTTVEVPEIDDTVADNYIEVEMPSDFFRAEKVIIAPVKGSMVIKDANTFRWTGTDTLLLPNRPAATYRIEYARYPVRYTSSTDITTELDNTPDTHEAIPFYVAAMIAVDENPKAYYALYNVWETRLSRMGQKQAYAVFSQVEDVYGFGGGYY